MHPVEPMTRDQWAAASSPRAMIELVIGFRGRVVDCEAFPDCRGSDRKLRLFAAACYRRIEGLLPDKVACRAVDVAEDFADGHATAADLAEVAQQLEVLVAPLWESRSRSCAYEALALATQIVRPEAPIAAYYASSNAYHSAATLTAPESRRREERAQADLLRCVFGPIPPAGERAGPATVRPAPDGATALAEEMYADARARRTWLGIDRVGARASARGALPVPDLLALEHLRQPGIAHPRGCWVVDGLLGKT